MRPMLARRFSKLSLLVFLSIPVMPMNFSPTGKNSLALLDFDGMAIAQLKLAQSSNDQRTQEITEAIYLKQSGYDRLQKGDPQGAIADLQKAIALFQKWKATGGERDTLNFLGEVYLTTGQYAQAMPYFQQALKMSWT